jgi:hypothetical protein
MRPTRFWPLIFKACRRNPVRSSPDRCLGCGMNAALCDRCFVMASILRKPSRGVNSYCPICPPPGAHSKTGSLFCTPKHTPCRPRSSLLRAVAERVPTVDHLFGRTAAAQAYLPDTRDCLCDAIPCFRLPLYRRELEPERAAERRRRHPRQACLGAFIAWHRLVEFLHRDF